MSSPYAARLSFGLDPPATKAAVRELGVRPGLRQAGIARSTATPASERFSHDRCGHARGDESAIGGVRAPEAFRRRPGSGPQPLRPGGALRRRSPSRVPQALRRPRRGRRSRSDRKSIARPSPPVRIPISDARSGLLPVRSAGNLVDMSWYTRVLAFPWVGVGLCTVCEHAGALHRRQPIAALAQRRRGFSTGNSTAACRRSSQRVRREGRLARWCPAQSPIRPFLRRHALVDSIAGWSGGSPSETRCRRRGRSSRSRPRARSGRVPARG